MFILMPQLKGVRVNGWVEKSRGRVCEMKVNFSFLDLSNSKRAPTSSFFDLQNIIYPPRGETRTPLQTSNIENFAIIVKS